jgi:hypothetical protein
MFSDNKISKGGLIGALLAVLASIFVHKNSDTKSRKVFKSGAIGAAGYLLGSLAEKKIYKHRNR